MKKDLTFGLIGTGKLGSAILAKLCGTSSLAWVVDRSLHVDWKQYIDIKFSKELHSELPAVDCILLALNDASLDPFLRSLHEEDLPICEYMCHFSGFLNNEIFESMEPFGKKCFSVHPMQTFGVLRNGVFDDVFFGAEVCDSTREFAEELINLLGGYFYELPKEITTNKPSYHAIGVAAANFLQSSIEFAKLLAENLKLPQKQLLPAILKTAFNNSLDSILNDTDFPLTGPVARCDAPSIALHKRSLAPNPLVAEIYAKQTESLALLAFERGIIDEECLGRIMGENF